MHEVFQSLRYQNEERASGSGLIAAGFNARLIAYTSKNET